MTPSHSSDNAVDDQGSSQTGADENPAPTTRRAAREAAARRAQQQTLDWSRQEYPAPQKPKGHRRWLRVTIVIVVIFGLFGGGGTYVWFTFQPQMAKLFGTTEPTDYPGDGSGSVTVSIKDGDIGSDIASTLHKDGVVKTADAFYGLLLRTKPDPVFQPGVYQLKKKMSAKAALAALQDPNNKLQRTVGIPEGAREADILASVAKATSIPIAELQAAAATPAAYGVPPEAQTLEGFLFPATYTFDPGVSAHDAIKTMVDRSFSALDDAGVAPADRWKVVVLASIVQLEAGSNLEDFGKIARVFQNRLDQGMLLQSDATVAYGANVKRVFTTDAERTDAGNAYNTYIHPGLTPGPIGNPGDVAIKAALHPTPGSWLYFVTTNLETGQTTFSTTLEEHDAAVEKLHEWCNASAANDEYCK